MTAVTIRIPQSKHARLRSLARARGISLDQFINELATVMIAHHEAETRFRARVARGRKKNGLELLKKLEAVSARRG